MHDAEDGVGGDQYTFVKCFLGREEDAVIPTLEYISRVGGLEEDGRTVREAFLHVPLLMAPRAPRCMMVDLTVDPYWWHDIPGITIGRLGPRDVAHIVRAQLTRGGMPKEEACYYSGISFRSRGATDMRNAGTLVRCDGGGAGGGGDHRPYHWCSYRGPGWMGRRPALWGPRLGRRCRTARRTGGTTP